MKVSVVMTVYGKEVFLEESILSILNQTYDDFEFLIVVEAGAHQDTIELVRKYEAQDNRIKLIFNKERLGLAESLNIGILSAKGEYIARMDDDDWSESTRFEKQVCYLDRNPLVGICGTLQRTIRQDRETVLQCATEPEDLKAEMLFGCQLSHTSVMFRRQLFVDNTWLYNGNYLAEDYHLWLDILDKTLMSNIDEILVNHRYGFGNISIKKGENLYQENINTIKNALHKYLGIDILEWSDFLFSPWRTFPKNIDLQKKKDLFIENLKFLQHLEKANKQKSFIATKNFNKMLWKRLCNVICNLGFYEMATVIESQKRDEKKSFMENVISVFKTLGIKCQSNMNAEIAVDDLSHLTIHKSSKIIIYGLGNAYKNFLDKYGKEKIVLNYDLIGVTDANSEYKNEVKYFICKENVGDYVFDYILISSGRYFVEIKEELVKKYKIPNDKIRLLEQMIWNDEKG